MQLLGIKVYALKKYQEKNIIIVNKIKVKKLIILCIPRIVF